MYAMRTYFLHVRVKLMSRVLISATRPDSDNRAAYVYATELYVWASFFKAVLVVDSKWRPRVLFKFRQFVFTPGDTLFDYSP